MSPKIVEIAPDPQAWNGFGPVRWPSIVMPAIRRSPLFSVMPTEKSKRNVNGSNVTSTSKATHPETLNPPASTYRSARAPSCSEFAVIAK